MGINKKALLSEQLRKTLETSPDGSILETQEDQELKAYKTQIMDEGENLGQHHVPTTQYITWVMLLVGWCLTFFLYKRNKKNTQKQRSIDRHNLYVKEFKDLLFIIESLSTEFWMSPEDGTDQMKLLDFQRKIKELTTKSREVSDSGGVEYPSALLKRLRRLVTLDNDQRPLLVNATRINELRETVSELANLYERKSD